MKIEEPLKILVIDQNEKTKKQLCNALDKLRKNQETSLVRA